jgi:hypothetical protein
LLVVIACLVAGCRTTQLPPPVDFQESGWRVQQGQAVWKPTSSRPSLAGELLLATRTNGDCFVQFDKIPFPLAEAQITGAEWHIRFGGGKYAWHGRGEPPGRFAWFQLPRALASQPLAKHWKFERDGESWRLENGRTGESLEGSVAP